MAQTKWAFKRYLVRTWAIFGTAFILWLFYSYHPHGVDDQLLQNSYEVHVDVTNDFYSFVPTKEPKKVLIFIQGRW